jgi:putative intracellular protease/amidase
MSPEYIDPPLGRSVTSEENARKTRELQQSDRLDNPKNLSEWFPDRPYRSSPNFLREMEAYYDTLDSLEQELTQYDALVIVGGSGAIVDLANNHRIHDLILRLLKVNRVVAAECYGVSCLAFAREQEDRRSIIRGRHVTGHPIEYDYKDGTGYIPSGNLNFGPPPYPLEFILRDAVGPEGQFHGNVGKQTSVIVDYPFVTGRSTADAYLTGQMLVEVLEKGLTRYGW